MQEALHIGPRRVLTRIVLGMPAGIPVEAAAAAIGPP
jgi:hypothetical protein